MTKNTFFNRLEMAITDPKVIVIILSAFISMGAWSGHILIEIGNLRSDVSHMKEQLILKDQYHKTEMKNMDDLITILTNTCSAVKEK